MHFLVWHAHSRTGEFEGVQRGAPPSQVCYLLNLTCRCFEEEKSESAKGTGRASCSVFHKEKITSERVLWVNSSVQRRKDKSDGINCLICM